MILSTEDWYPEGKQGDLAVCFVLPIETSWSFEPVIDRKEADELFETTRNREDVRKIPVKGRASSVVWIVECHGGLEWAVPKATGAAEQYLREWGC